MAIPEEEEIDQVSIESAEIHNMAAEYKCCCGRGGTNASWVWMSTVGADQVRPKGLYVSTRLSCIDYGLIVFIFRSRTITRKLRNKFQPS